VQEEYLKKRQEKKRHAFFYPDIPPKEAVVTAVLKSLGYDFHNDPEKEASISIAWENETYKKRIEKGKDILKNAWNSNCIDIGKTYTDEIFEKVFGYSTRLYPKTHRGKILEKNELNGHHEARILKGPIKNPKEGYIYQMVINNNVRRYYFEDIRIAYIKGNIPFCYLTYRLKGKRFSTKKFNATLAKPSDVLSQIEIKKVDQFCREMKVDFAEIDTLRDRDDNKLYLIDVNPTAYGPATGLNYENKIKALKMYQEEIIGILNQ